MDVAALPLDEFLTRLGSSDPTPGGGALAAVVGAEVAAMLAMVCNLTIGRPRYADVEARVRDLLTEATGWQERLVALANADADAYQTVMDAYRLPRGEEAATTARAAAIERAMHGATEVPIETMEACRRLLDLALLAAELTNVNTLGDVAVAGHIGLGATRAAAAQAGLNTASLSDKEFAAAMQERRERALADAEPIVTQTIATIKRRTES